MKKFVFNNGEERLESQIKKGRDFKTACILWGCFDKETGEPLPYTTHKATKEELKAEKIRLAEIKEEYEAICEYNEKISRGNERLAKATNIHEFLNAYNL